LVREAAGVLKVGLELFVREGPRAVGLGQDLGSDIFLDLKLHDIPETVRRAVGSAAALGVRYLTVHTGGGPRMLEAAVAAAQGSGVTLLGVTVLTSLDARDLEAVGVAGGPAEQTVRLAKLAQSVGIPGLVCSTAEVARLRTELGPDVVLVTPGIRPRGAKADDQKRVGTPASAISAGSTLLVVGRPIRDADDPAEAARTIVAEIADAAQ